MPIPKNIDQSKITANGRKIAHGRRMPKIVKVFRLQEHKRHDAKEKQERKKDDV